MIVELGANDYLNDLQPETTRDNLEDIINSCRASGAVVFICRFFSDEMADEYSQSDPDGVQALITMYASLAERERVFLVEDIWGDIRETPGFMHDAAHPSGEGYQVLLLEKESLAVGASGMSAAMWLAGGRGDQAEGADPLAELCRLGHRVEPEHSDRAAIRMAQALEAFDGGRLPSAVRAEDAEDLALLDAERQVIDGRCVAVGLAQLIHCDHCHDPMVVTETGPWVRSGKPGPGYINVN